MFNTVKTNLLVALYWFVISAAWTAYATYGIVVNHAPEVMGWDWYEWVLMFAMPVAGVMGGVLYVVSAVRCKK